MLKITKSWKNNSSMNYLDIRYEITASCTVLSGRTKCQNLQKVEKQLKHELFRYKVRNLLTATCTVYEKFPWAFLHKQCNRRNS
jgi:hypothetical protein